jgi:atypical dual specificity phosphatase
MPKRISTVPIVSHRLRMLEPMSRQIPKRLQLMLNGIGLGIDRGDWLLPDQVLACAYPKSATALASLQAHGITVLINLHERPHSPSVLETHSLTTVHIPIADFTAPTPEQIDEGVAAIDAALAGGGRVAVHCGAGLGRTGTLLACYLVSKGVLARQAIGDIRQLRPGSIETGEQVAAIHAYEEAIAGRHVNGDEAAGP